MLNRFALRVKRNGDGEVKSTAACLGLLLTLLSFSFSFSFSLSLSFFLKPGNGTLCVFKISLLERTKLFRMPSCEVSVVVPPLPVGGSDSSVMLINWLTLPMPDSSPAWIGMSSVNEELRHMRGEREKKKWTNYKQLNFGFALLANEKKNEIPKKGCIYINSRASKVNFQKWQIWLRLFACLNIMKKKRNNLHLIFALQSDFLSWSVHKQRNRKWRKRTTTTTTNKTKTIWNKKTRVRSSERET